MTSSRHSHFQESIDMKKALLIFISVALIVMAIICVVKYKQVPDEAHAYISNQKEQQRELAERQVDSLFVLRHTDIFPIYFGCKSRFVKGDASRLPDHTPFSKKSFQFLSSQKNVLPLHPTKSHKHGCWLRVGCSLKGNLQQNIELRTVSKS